MSATSLSELLDALNARPDSLFLLPNARAARELRARFDASQRAAGVQAWEPPAVLSWAQWTASLWSDLVVAGAETRLLLNPAQELSLWREIVAEDAESAGGSVESLAEMAASGFALAAHYQATTRLRNFAATHDSRIFAGWAEAFTRRCGTKGYLPAALLEEQLREHAERSKLTLPASVELIGFGERTPVQEALLAAIRIQGCAVLEHALTAASGERAVSVIAANERDELHLAARWVRDFVAQHPQARVAMLVPGLGDERAELEDVLREVLAPELQAVGTDLSSTPWEISGGVPLLSVAMIADVLALAHWVDGALPLQRVSGLLLSPYTGASADLDAAARFDAHWLRRAMLLRSEIGIPALLAMVEQADENTEAPLLPWLRNLQLYLKRDGDRTRPREFAEWMEFVRGLGQAAGWPGARPLTATEFAASQAWESALDTVSTLDFSGKRVSYPSALEALDLQLKSTALTMPATGASVQVMGVAESEGSVFDAVVFLRATDANWPAPERVHPLLPWSMQRSLKMPGNDSALTLMRARSFTEALLARSGRVLFTSAAEDGSGALRSSPLIAELGLHQVAAETLVGAPPDVDYLPVQTAEDDEPLPALPPGLVRGGATVLKLQAACGFLAFAEMRLRATEPQNGSLGLDAGESGSVLHKAMQAFWRTVETQQELRAMSTARRDELLTEAIDASLPRRLRAESGWDVAYVEMTKQRLRAVLRQWLALELERGPFEVVAVEQDQEVTVGPLTLSVRMDRIDKVGGGYFFVDYKTGYAADPKQWEGDRPDDPQLPLYALIPAAGELKGVAFAKVRAGRDMKWIGYQAEPGILPPSRVRNVRDMPSLVAEWHGTLTQLADEFSSGDARVRPKSFEVNCVRCGQRLLCRLDKLTLLEAEEEPAQDAEELDG